MGAAASSAHCEQHAVILMPKDVVAQFMRDAWDVYALVCALAVFDRWACVSERVSELGIRRYVCI